MFIKWLAKKTHTLSLVFLILLPIAWGMYWQYERIIKAKKISIETICGIDECRLTVNGASPLSRVFHSGKIGDLFGYTDTDISGHGESVIPPKEVTCKLFTNKKHRKFEYMEFKGLSVDSNTSMSTEWSMLVVKNC